MEDMVIIDEAADIRSEQWEKMRKESIARAQLEYMLDQQRKPLKISFRNRAMLFTSRQAIVAGNAVWS